MAEIVHRLVSAKMIEAEIYVDRFIKENVFPPTYQQVATELKLASKNSAYNRLKRYRHKMKQTEKKWVWTTELIMEYAKHFYRSNGKSSIQEWKDNYIW